MFCGLGVVLLSFLTYCGAMMGADTGKYLLTQSAGPLIWVVELVLAFVLGSLAGISFMGVGSFATLGLPWWLGLAVSSLFVRKDNAQHVQNEALDAFMNAR